MSEANEAKKVYRKYSRLALEQGWRIEETHDGWKFLPRDLSQGLVVLGESDEEEEQGMERPLGRSA